ncbi:transcriptional regulator [Streptococcus macedonicus]|nr:transcriptional regulator [Streptococcus macedonicus]PJH78073.1 XRE family transcriptional regulator [Streptococcus thermophilus]
MNDFFFDKPKNRLELLMQENNYTLKKVSENTGIPVTTLSGYKKNLRTPKKENALKLADYFGVSVPYLLGLDDNPPALNDSLEKIMVIHEVLNAGDNILVAQELLKNSLETLVKYADNDYRVQFKHHLLIANTLSEVIGKLDIVTENDELSFTPDKLNLSNN